MQPENWKTIKAALLEALELDTSGRRAYLDNADLSPEVRAEVESLLTQQNNSKDFMSLTASGFARELFDGSGSSADPLINQKIGIYEIVSELGLGGMGAVYLAMRRDGKFEQKVAIKMLKREFNTEKIRRTFTREKEILATLAHPNIATLLDAGATDDGIPYLVMEYIEGEPIDKFCEGLKLSLNSRLKLFNKVCEAVAFAHRSLIVHRDLKPSNILVTKDGEPKLLDFGISKLLDPAADSGNITQPGGLTPLYASPEQLKGEPVNTATDVYSLGVVLFKLLSGSLPHTAGTGAEGYLPNESLTQPTLPSEVARRSASTGDAPTIPISPSELKGDLDNIVLKALRKEPERRYPTVEQFSADIWRFIDGMPVLARPATFSYRARKFYGRNKVPVLAAAFILISLFAGIAIAVFQANAARAQARIAAGAQRQAELETERTKAEKQKAERTSRFMQSFLEYANPHWYGRGKGRLDVTVRKAIDDAAGRIDTELADEPEVRAGLHYTVGEVYGTHGEYEISLRHFRQSLDLYRQVHGEQHPKVARGIYYVCVGMSRMGAAGIEELEPLLRQSVAMMRQTDRDNVNLPYMLQSLAQWIISGEKQSRNESRLAEAESFILEARPLFIRHYGEDHVATISADGSLAMLALTRGDLAQAERINQELIGRYQQAEGGAIIHTGALLNLAEIKLALGKVAEAEELFGQALEEGRREWGATDFRFELLAKRIRKARAASGK
ncbi:MAG TPA: serine/threonine-protein kinase [Pyrinomonadaceae bacterium]